MKKVGGIWAGICLLAFMSSIAFSQSSEKTGQVSGRVLNVDQSPAFGIDVVFISAADVINTADIPVGVATRLPLGPKVAVARTDIQGQYHVDSLPLGSYRIAAGIVVKCSPPTACLIASRWLDNITFYPGVAELALAKQVTVTSQNSAINFSLLK